MLLAGLLYANTLSHDYALDDKIVLSNNQFTQKGIGGIWDHLTNESFVGFFGKQKELVAGARYRPLSLITFSIEYAFFGESPGVSHFFNLLFYALTALILYRWLRALLKQEDALLSVAFLATLLFVVHPLHTEVVANIKGRDDLLAFLLAAAAGWYMLRDVPSARYLTGVYFFLALLAKESAIAIVLIYPLSLWVARADSRTWQRMIPIGIATVAFLALRFSVVGFPKSDVADQLMNNPFLEMNTSEKYATIVYTLGQYVKLSFVPYPLTHDYYPYHIAIQQWTSAGTLLSLGAIVLGTIGAIIGLLRRQWWGFGIAVFFLGLGLTSNVLFPVGVFMSERFAYISTMGWALSIGWFMKEYLFKDSLDWSKAPSLAKGVLVSLALVFSVLTVARNRDWKDDATLVSKDIKTSAESAKVNFTYGKMKYLDAMASGNQQTRRQLLQESNRALAKSERIDPTLPDTYNLLALTGYYLTGNPDVFVQNYLRLFELNRDVDKKIILKNIQDLTKNDPTSKQIQIYEGLYPVMSGSYDLNMILATTYSRVLKNFQKSIPYYQKALEIKPKSEDAWKDLALIYQEIGEYDESLAAFKELEKLRPQDKKVKASIGKIYNKMGQADSSAYYKQLAK
ncbi:glycosyltransferase family 39 protein [Cryomorphaceae bacterium]|nr:glycosyltransferase family 39 protein [Cryomorphaceae bacterium]